MEVTFCPVSLSDEKISSLEAKLSNDTDSLVSSTFQNDNPGEFVQQMKYYLNKKKDEIFKLCGKNSDIFGKNVEEAKKLGTEAYELQNTVRAITGNVSTKFEDHKKLLEKSVKIQNDIASIDAKYKASTEFLVVLQKLKNINTEIEQGNYYIAVVRILEFADYDSNISGSSVIRKYQEEIPNILKHIEKLSLEKFQNWLLLFKDKCESIGNSYLSSDDEIIFDLSPVYEYYMIAKQLGEAEAFVNTYADKRKKGLNLLLEEKSNVTTPNALESIQSLFDLVAGFFYIESRISNEGFCLMPQTQVEKFWVEKLGHLKREFSQRIANEKVDEMIALSKMINHFSERMALCSLNASELMDSIKTRSGQFRKTLQKNGGNQIKQIIESISPELFVANSQNDISSSIKYQLCEMPSKFPFEAKFSIIIPKVCELIEGVINRWNDFSVQSQGEHLFELYETLTTFFINTMRSQIEKLDSIPHTAFLVSSLVSFDGSIGFFEQSIYRLSTISMWKNKERIRRSLVEAQDFGIGHLGKQFNLFILEMFTPSYLKQIIKEPPPCGTTFQLVVYFDTMSTILQPLLPKNLFQKLVDAIAKNIAERLIYLIIIKDDIVWTPDYLLSVSQNIIHISNWSTFLSYPSAKSHLNGIINMFNLLSSTQLAAQFNDPHFINNNKSIPYDALVIILIRYSPQTKLKNAVLIQKPLVDSIIQKCTPECRNTTVLQAISARKK